MFPSNFYTPNIIIEAPVPPPVPAAPVPQENEGNADPFDGFAQAVAMNAERRRVWGDDVVEIGDAERYHNVCI